MIQDTSSYAAAAAAAFPSRGPAGVDAEMTSPNNTAACDPSTNLVLCVTARECMLLGGNTVTPITSCLRGRCLLFSQLTRHQRTL